MKILSVAQIREWDRVTIERQRINSVELMERAAQGCVKWIVSNIGSEQFAIFCGPGNNGGDGLAIARLLRQQAKQVTVFVLPMDGKGSPDFEANLRSLKEAGCEPEMLDHLGRIPILPPNSIIIDALFGSGLSRKIDGFHKTIIDHLNGLGQEIISIDIPSGLFADSSSLSNTIVKASHTLTFQSPKLAFLVAENEPFIGKIHVIDIGLDEQYAKEVETDKQLIDEGLIRKTYKPRKDFSHKGSFGHVLIMAGSRGKMGAAVLAARACVRTGSGLVTSYLPAGANLIMQISVPEVMVIDDENDQMLTGVPELNKYQAVGIGPGIGKHAETMDMMRNVLQSPSFRLVLDADALNILGENRDLLVMLPEQTIITPHPKEFERLFGATANEFERLALASNKAVELKLIIVLKGHHTAVCLPDGSTCFNTTGNSGMAKGGSGDTLTGILTSLAGQQYPLQEAAILGVYLHGLAGDIAAERHSQDAMLPSDLSDCLGDAFRRIAQTSQDF